MLFSRIRNWASAPASWPFVFLAALYPVLAGVPAPPFAMGPGLDAGWVMGLSMAHAQGLEPGREFVFTYGPLGYLMYSDPASVPVALALGARLAVWLLWAVALVFLLRALGSRARAAAAAGVFAFASALVPAWPLDQLELAVLTFAVLAVARGASAPSFELGMLAVLAGAAALIKGNLALESAALLILLLTMGVLRHRSRAAALPAALTLAAWPLTAVVLYWISSGRLASFPSYIRQSLEIAATYSDGQSQAGPLWQAGLAVISIAALFAFIPAVADDFRALLPGLIPAAVAVFFYFKHGFVCQDGHAVTFQIRLALAALFAFACAATARDRRLIGLFQFTSLFLGMCITFDQYPQTRPEFTSRLTLSAAVAAVSPYTHWNRTWRDLQEQGDSALAEIRLPERFHTAVGKGSVDAMPWDVALVRANGWEWRPRPVFQSYSVQSESLDRLNANHILGPRAADFVLMHWAPVRGRHPLFEDPLSWRALLERYQVVLGDVQTVLLRRTAGPRFGAVQQLGSMRARFGDAIEIPAAPELLLMAADIRPSLQGRLRNLLFRTDPVLLEATFESGEKTLWRVMRASLTGGVIVSHLPRDLADLASLFHGDLRALGRVRSVRFYAERLNQYQPEIDVRWLSLPAPAYSGEPASVVAAARVPLWRPSGQFLRVGDDEHPAQRFDLGPALGRFPTVVIRARFENPGRLEIGQLKGRIPEGGRWFDIYVSASHSPLWPGKGRLDVRFEPSAERPAPTGMEIAGVWGIAGAVPDAGPDVQVLEPSTTP